MYRWFYYIWLELYIFWSNHLNSYQVWKIYFCLSVRTSMAWSAGTIYIVGFYVGSTWRHITDKLTVSFYSRMRVLIKYEHNRSLWQSGYLTVLFCNEKIERQRKKEKRKRKKEKQKRNKDQIYYSKSTPNLHLHSTSSRSCNQMLNLCKLTPAINQCLVYYKCKFAEF